MAVSKSLALFAKYNENKHAQLDHSLGHQSFPMQITIFCIFKMQMQNALENPHLSLFLHFSVMYNLELLHLSWQQNV